MRKIIDLSEANGGVDWTAAAAHIDGAILRAGYRGWGSGGIVSDRMAQYHLDAAIAAGVPVGIYFVTQAITEAEAVEEADWAVAALHGRPCRLPICLDDEPAGGANGRGRRDLVDSDTRTRTAVAFVRRIAALGYTPALYCANSWFRGMLDGEAVRAAGALVWISSYPARRGAANVPPTVAWDGWQYSPWASVPGIGTDVDMSWFRGALSGEEDNMTLEQFTSLLQQYRATLQDNDAAAFSEAARRWAVESGLVQGGSGGSYMWQDFLTREQLVTVLYRFAQLLGRA